MTTVEINTLFLCLQFKLKFVSSDKLLCYFNPSRAWNVKTCRSHFNPFDIKWNTLLSDPYEYGTGIWSIWTAAERSEPVSNERSAAILVSSFMKICQFIVWNKIRTFTDEKSMTEPGIQHQHGFIIMILMTLIFESQLRYNRITSGRFYKGWRSTLYRPVISSSK